MKMSTSGIYPKFSMLTAGVKNVNHGEFRITIVLQNHTRTATKKNNKINYA